MLRRILAILVVCGLSGAAWSPRGEALPGSLREIQDGLDAAWRDKDQHRVQRLLEHAWALDREWARDATFGLVRGKDAGLQPVGLAVFARRASAQELIAAAEALRGPEGVDARRMLVRRLGAHRSKEVREPVVRAIRGFLRDSEPVVRAAAAQALADLGDEANLDLIAGLLQEPPAQRNRQDGDNQSIVNMAMYGAVRTLAGLRPRQAREVADYLRGARERRAEPFDESAAPVEGRRAGDRYLESPSFDVYYRIGRGGEAPESGYLAWKSLVPLAEEAAKLASEACEPIFGPSHMPIIRLYIADEQQYMALGGRSNLGGTASGNQIVVRTMPARQFRGVLAHEYVHIIHAANYKDQPRWISEGLAESLTRSARASQWTPERVAAANIEREVRQGAVSNAMQWVSGASGDSREGERYALSHVVVDFLRFGGFAAPEERLAMLMGRLSRREAPGRSVEELYGGTARQLDQRLLEWLERRER